jgi:hypothetical protein
MNNAKNNKIQKKRKPPMPGTKRKYMISIKKRTTNIQVQNKVYRKCIKEVKKQSSVSDDECSEELIEIPIKKRKKPRIWTIDDVKEHAIIRGGECLTDIYRGTREKYKFRCHRGHIFESRLSHVLHCDRWCSKCIIYVGEEITRKIMTKLFGTDFYKVHPKWLNGMELDGFNNELMIAFEYDGKQHHKFLKMFHKTKEGFIAQQERDRLKDKLCKEHGIALIRVPYNVNYKDIKDYICQKCKEMNINIPYDMIINYKLFEGIYTKDMSYNRLKEIVESKNMKLIDRYFISWHEQIEMECSKGHRIHMRANNIKKSRGCTKCYESRKDTLDDIKKIAKVHGCECVSEEYVNSRVLMDYVCNKGHKFRMKYANRKIRGDAWCHFCRNDKYIKHNNDVMYHKIVKIADKYGGKCITPEYKSRRGVMEFECKKGHRFKTSYDSLVSNKSWCHACGVGQKSIEDMRNLAKKYNGICLSTEYKSLITDMNWKCNQCGNIFTRSPGNIINRGIFCSNCRE